MKGLGIQLQSTTDLNAVSSIQDVIAEYQCILHDDIGTFKGVATKITLQENAKPKFFKPRPDPFAMLDRVNGELLRIERTGVLRPVKASEWATPIVPILKRSGQIRICGDFKVTVNSVSVPENYPIPRVENMFTKWCVKIH